MNHEHPFDDAAQEREWLAQERALDAERRGLASDHDDACTRRYRLLARTLREPLPDALPADFARQMAARTVAPMRRPDKATGFELALVAALAAAMLVAAGVVTADYGHTWLPAFRSLLPAAGAPSTGWLLALAGCLAATWLLGLWQRHAHGGAAA